MNFHRHLAPFENRENQTSKKEEAHKMNIYGTLPRAQIRRRQPLQRIDSENSETDDASKTLHLTKATTFFNDKDDQDFYGVNNLDLNQNIQSFILYLLETFQWNVNYSQLACHVIIPLFI